jgi:hypothetical protein
MIVSSNDVPVRVVLMLDGCCVTKRRESREVAKEQFSIGGCLSLDGLQKLVFLYEATGFLQSVRRASQEFEQAFRSKDTTYLLHTESSILRSVSPLSTF